MQARCLPIGPAAHPGLRRTLPVVQEGIEPPFPLCEREVVAAGPRDDAACARDAHVEWHRWELNPQITWVSPRPLCQFAYRAIIENFFTHCGYGSRTTSTPAYETGLSTGPPANPRPRGRSGKAGLMRADWAPATPGLAVSWVERQRSIRNSPDGSRTRLATLKEWCPHRQTTGPETARSTRNGVRRTGVEPAKPGAGGLRPPGLANAQPTQRSRMTL